MLHSFAVRLTITLVCTALIPPLILAGVNGSTTQAALIEAANQSLASAASQVAQTIDGELEAIDTMVQADAKNPAVVAYLAAPNDRENRRSLTAVLGDLRGRIRQTGWAIDSYAVLDAAGVNVTDTALANIGQDESRTPHLAEAIAVGGPYQSSVFFEADGAAVYFISPVVGAPRGQARRLLGFMRLRLNLGGIQRLVLEEEGLVPAGFPILLSEYNAILESGDNNTTRLAAPPSDPIDILQDERRLPEDVAVLESQFSLDQPFFTAQLRGNQYQVAVVSLERQPWLVAYVQPRAVILQPGHQQTQIAWLVTGLVAVAAVGLGLGLGRFFTYPLSSLTKVAGHIAAGQLTGLAWPNPRRDELGVLAQSFQAMTKRLHALINDLETQVTQRTEQLNAARQQSDLIADLNESLAQAVDTAQILAVVTLVVKDYPGFTGAVLAYLNNQLELEPVASLGDIQFATLDWVPFVTHEDAPTMVIRDVQTDPHLSSALRETGIAALVALPLKTAGEQAAILIAWDTPQPFNDDIHIITQAIQPACSAVVATQRLIEHQEQTIITRTAEAQQAQVQLIAAQQQLISELSTPIIPLLDRILVMPLIGSIDSHRTRDIMRALLAGISQHNARVIILDITGVSIVDSEVAGHLNKTIQAARLKGCQTIVTGIGDAVAETIVDLGIDWSGVETLATLDAGLKKAVQMHRTNNKRSK